MQSWESPTVVDVEWLKDTSMIEVDELREELYPWLERRGIWGLPSLAWIHDLDEVETVLPSIQFEEDKETSSDGEGGAVRDCVEWG